MMQDYVETTTGETDVHLVSHGMHNMGRDDRGIIIALAQNYVGAGEHAPTGHDLVAQTAMVRTIMDSAGFKDPARALEYMPGVEAYARQHAANRLSTPTVPVLPADVGHDVLTQEVGQMSMQVVRACMVTQDRGAACDNVQFVDLVAQSTRGNNIGSTQAAYQTAHMIFDPTPTAYNLPVAATPITTVLGGATAHAVHTAGNANVDLYRAPTQGVWNDAARIQVRQEFQNAGAIELMGAPGVAETVRQVYEYSPALVPQYITALQAVGPTVGFEHANLGTAILIRDLEHRFGWIERDMNFANLAIAEHLRVRGQDTYLADVQNTDLRTLAAGTNPAMNGGQQLPIVLDGHSNIVPPRNTDIWT